MQLYFFGRHAPSLSLSSFHPYSDMPLITAKQDKSEQTESTPDEFELDDCLLESNDIVITQNKDGFVLHVKKLGNITAAKLSGDEEQTAAVTVTGPAGQPTQTITELLSAAAHSSDVKPTLTTLTNTPIKLPSSECGKLNMKINYISTISTFAFTNSQLFVILQSSSILRKSSRLLRQSRHMAAAAAAAQQQPLYSRTT